MHNNNACRVCGYELPSPPWGKDGASPTWDICPCCGTEFGYEDCTPASAREKRAQWIAGGMKWFDRRKTPLDWDYSIQCLKIPNEYK